MEARLIEAMDRGEWLENHEEAVRAKMYRDTTDDEYGPYVYIVNDCKKYRASTAFDWTGWEIMKKPTARPATRMEALYDITGPDHQVMRGEESGSWYQSGYLLIAEDTSMLELGTIHADGTVTDIRKLTRPVE